MDQTGDQFLSAAGLAADVDRCLAAGNFPGLASQVFNFGGVAQQQVFTLWKRDVTVVFGKRGEAQRTLYKVA